MYVSATTDGYYGVPSVTLLRSDPDFREVEGDGTLPKVRVTGKRVSPRPTCRTDGS